MNNNFLKTQELMGKPVISLGGEEVGTVQKVIVDPATTSVVGLIVNLKGIFKGEKVLEFNAVHAFGSFAVTVEEGSRVVPLNTLPALEKLAQVCDMHKMKALTPSGNLVGEVDDFSFATADGKITSYFISGGLIKNLMLGRAVIPADGIEKIGPNIIIAKDDIEQYITKEDPGLQESIDNLKEDLSGWKEDLNKAWDKTLVRAKEVSKIIGEKVKDATKEGKGTSKKIIEKSTVILNDKGKDLKTTYEVWSDRLKTLKNKPEKPLSAAELTALTGQRVSKTITDDSSLIIIAKNEVVSEEIVNQAVAAGRLKELLLAVATSEVNEKIESIEKEI